MSNAERIHIVTGSTSDVPAPWAEKHNVGIVPAVITFGTEEIRDTAEFTMEAFLNKLKGSIQLNIIPTTAAPGPEVFKHFYEYQGPIISVHAGDKISSFWTSSVTAVNELQRENIYSYNTLSVSLGEGFLAMTAAELEEQGASMQDIIQTLNAMRPRTHVAALCDTLEYLKHSGRVTGAQAFLGSMLNVKPSIHAYENAVVPLARERTHKKAVAGLVDWVKKFKPFERFAVLHNGNLEYAKEVAYALRDEFEQEKMLITLITKAVTAHVGPDVVGVAFVTAR